MSYNLSHLSADILFPRSAAYNHRAAAYTLRGPAYTHRAAAYMQQCENKANLVQLSWSWDLRLINFDNNLIFKIQK